MSHAGLPPGRSLASSPVSATRGRPLGHDGGAVVDGAGGGVLGPTPASVATSTGDRRATSQGATGAKLPASRSARNRDAGMTRASPSSVVAAYTSPTRRPAS